MTEQERGLLRVVARRAAALGLDCGKPGCPHQGDTGGGGKCPHLAECVAENRALQEFGRATTAGADPQITQITQMEIRVKCGYCGRKPTAAEVQTMLEGALCPGCGKRI